MSFVLFTDSSSNITPDLAKAWDVRILSLHYALDGEEHPAYDEAFDGHVFYNALRSRTPIRTSMINSAQFLTAFEPVLEGGQDILYIGMSSGISGTVGAAQTAADELMRKYPERRIWVKDTLAASFGEGLFVKKAHEMRQEGRSLKEICDWIDAHVQSMNQVFTVDDLMYLRHGGRISGITALIGTLANIKPILWGDIEGRIAMTDRMIGRKKSLRAVAERYAERTTSQDETIAIAHGDCEADAQYLAKLIRDKIPGQDILIRCYEPGTGAHVGPGAVALFFFGKERSVN